METKKLFFYWQQNFTLKCGLDDAEMFGSGLKIVDELTLFIPLIMLLL